MNAAVSFLPDGVLCQARGSRFGDRVFFCRRGRRHYLTSSAHVASLGKRWPEDVVQVDEAVLAAFTVGSDVPELSAAKAWTMAEIETSSVRMREHFALPLSGYGLEVGAGATPFPVPLRCHVVYGDRVSHAALVRTRYAGQSEDQVVWPDLQTEFDTLAGVGDGSLDFVIGCHVIESTRDPIGAIAAAWRKLRPGGHLLLVVSDKDRTFDRRRPLTTLEHLVADHERPDRVRDYQHYVEFYTLAFETPAADRAAVIDREFAREGEIHYHVWTHDSFLTMVEHINRHVVAWEEVVSHGPLAHPELDIEFYVRLRKGATSS